MHCFSTTPLPNHNRPSRSRLSDRRARRYSTNIRQCFVRDKRAVRRNCLSYPRRWPPAPLWQLQLDSAEAPVLAVAEPHPAHHFSAVVLIGGMGEMAWFLETTVEWTTYSFALFITLFVFIYASSYVSWRADPEDAFILRLYRCVDAHSKNFSHFNSWNFIIHFAQATPFFSCFLHLHSLACRIRYPLIKAVPCLSFVQIGIHSHSRWDKPNPIILTKSRQRTPIHYCLYFICQQLFFWAGVWFSH